MESLNEINEACTRVTRIIINIFLKQWVEKEENPLLQQRNQDIWGAHDVSGIGNSDHITFSLPHPSVAVGIF